MSVSEMGYGLRTAAVAPISWYAEQRDRTVHDARERFARACAAVGIPLLSANDEPAAPPAASWREVEGPYVETAVQRAAAFDLMVAASATVMETLMAIAEQSLLQTRRPVLLAPARLQSDLTQRDDRLGRKPGVLARGLGRHTVHAVCQISAGHQR